MKIRTHATLAIALILFFGQSTFAGKKNDKGAQFGALFYDGETVGTVATPTSMPGKGIDAIYVISNGTEGQLGVTSVAPGDKDYHGGRWAVYVMTWIGEGDTPLFTSEYQVLHSFENGELSMERMPDADFVCPVRKNG